MYIECIKVIFLQLNLIGVTVDKGHPYLHIGCKEHTFDPVPIGICSYPRQVIPNYTHSNNIMVCSSQVLPLYNGGDTVVGYKVDVSVLNDLTAQNYLMPVFECLQSIGNIFPGRTLPLEFIFAPIEAKKYTVGMSIANRILIGHSIQSVQQSGVDILFDKYLS